MSRQSLPASRSIEGEIVADAKLNGLDMAYMNFAREECQKLEVILLRFVVPAMGGYDNKLACDVARHLEQIKSFTGNFCWKYRHAGSAHDAALVGGDQ